MCEHDTLCTHTHLVRRVGSKQAKMGQVWTLCVSHVNIVSNYKRNVSVASLARLVMYQPQACDHWCVCAFLGGFVIELGP